MDCVIEIIWNAWKALVELVIRRNPALARARWNCVKVEWEELAFRRKYGRPGQWKKR